MISVYSIVMKTSLRLQFLIYLTGNVITNPEFHVSFMTYTQEILVIISTQK